MKTNSELASKFDLAEDDIEGSLKCSRCGAEGAIGKVFYHSSTSLGYAWCKRCRVRYDRERKTLIKNGDWS